MCVCGDVCACVLCGVYVGLSLYQGTVESVFQSVGQIGEASCQRPHTHIHTHTRIHTYTHTSAAASTRRGSARGFVLCVCVFVCFVVVCLCGLLLCVCVFCFVCLCGMYTHVYKHRNTFHSESVTLSTAHAAKRRQRGIALLKPLLHGWAAARHGCVRARAQTCHGGEVEHLPISRLTQQALVSAVQCQWVRYRSLVHHFLQHLHCVCSVVRPCKASA